MVLLCFAALSVLLTSVFCQESTVYYFCSDNGNTRALDFYVRENTVDVTHVGAYDVSTNTSLQLACDSNVAITFPFPINPRREISGDGTAASPFHLSVTINKQTGSAEPQCGYESTSPSVHTFILETTSSPTGSWDQQNVITCDFTNTAAFQLPTVKTSVTVTQIPVTVVSLNDSYLFEFLDANLQPLAIVTTNSVILKATFLSGIGISAPVTDAIGISPHTCKICDVRDCSGSYVVSLTDSNGCPINNLFYTHGFQGDGVTLVTSEAFLPNLYKHKLVFFVCINDYCTPSTGLSKCQDRCGALSGRKKRDTDHAQDRKSFNPWESFYFSNSYDKEKSCFGRYGVIIASLVAILNISVIVSIVQCNYLIKSKSKSQISSYLNSIQNDQFQKI